MKLSASIITKSLLAILIGMGLLGLDVQAQEPPAITVTIPFAFSANNENDIPAGTYQLRLISEWLLSIRNLNSREQRILIVRPGRSESAESRGCLLFDRFKCRHYLLVIDPQDS